jgi:hypothetical protein
MVRFVPLAADPGHDSAHGPAHSIHVYLFAFEIDKIIALISLQLSPLLVYTFVS